MHLLHLDDTGTDTGISSSNTDVCSPMEVDITDTLSGIQGDVLHTDLGKLSHLLSTGVPSRVGGERRRKMPRIQRDTTAKSRDKDWRLIDSEFDKLHRNFGFTLEACCDSKGLNGHANLPYCSELDSFLDKDVTGQRIFLNPPWKLAAKFVKHVRQCHAKDPENTMAIVVLPKWPCFSHITKDLVLYHKFPQENLCLLNRQALMDQFGIQFHRYRGKYSTG